MNFETVPHDLKVAPKHCVVKMGITCQNLTNHKISQNRDTGFSLVRKTIGCLVEPQARF